MVAKYSDTHILVQVSSQTYRLSFKKKKETMSVTRDVCVTSVLTTVDHELSCVSSDRIAGELQCSYK